MDDKLGRLSILILVVLSILFCLGNLLHHFLVIDSSVFWFYHRTQPAYDDEATLASDVPVSMRERITAKNAHSDYSKCDMHSCFDIKRCSEWSSERNIFQAVSVPTLKGTFRNSGWYSIEFRKLLKAMEEEIISKSVSTFTTIRKDEACVAIPAADLLDENRDLQSTKKRSVSSFAKNSLVFNFVPNATKGYFHSSLGYAMVASSGLLLANYRTNFDVSIPFYSEPPESHGIPDESLSVRTNILLITASEKSTAAGMHRTSELKLCLDKVNHITHRCKKSVKANDNQEEVVVLVDEMLNSEFCLLPEGSWYRQADLSSALLTGCVPILTCDAFVPPFAGLIDWKGVALLYYGRSKEEVRQLIKEIKIDHIRRLRQKGREVYEAYFSGMEQIVRTVFEVIHRRFDPIFNLKPLLMTSSGNGLIDVREELVEKSDEILSWNSLFINNMRFMRHYSHHQLQSERFTAIILTHDRVACLFDIVQTLMLVPACEKVIVVWNNQERQCPPQSEWPQVSKPLKVINMVSNKLNNRFLPFKDISTDAVLSLDDDMNDITVAEITDAFRVWQLNPTRLVGFFGWYHVFDNDYDQSAASTAENEKLSTISTALMFYHQSFAQLFVDHSTEQLFEWIENHQNCEDIAFNFFVSNLTSQAPIQVKRNQEISAKSVCDVNKTDSQPKSKNSCFKYLREMYRGNLPKSSNFYVRNLQSTTNPL